MIPQTRFARSGKVNIAYQVIGDGALDLVYVPGWVSHLELRWEEPDHPRFLHRLASFSRLITFDKRGTGLSDRVPDDQLPSLEVRMDDLRAVMDAVGHNGRRCSATPKAATSACYSPPAIPSAPWRWSPTAASPSGSGVPIIRGRQRRRHERRNTNSSSANGATRWTSAL